MKKLTVLLLLGFITACGAGRADLKEYVLYGTANRYYSIEDYENALIHYAKTLLIYPGGAYADDAQYWMAMSYINLGYYTDAQDELEDLMDHITPENPLYYDVLYSMGGIQYSLGDVSTAVETFESLVLSEDDTVKNRLKAINALAEIYYNNGQYLTAYTYYQKIIINHKESDYYQKALLRSGIINYNEESYQEAIDDFETLYESFPLSDYADNALYNAANVYFEIGEYDTALEYFTTVVQGYTDSELLASALFGMAECYVHQGDSDSAKAVLTKLASLFEGTDLGDNALERLSEL